MATDPRFDVFPDEMTATQERRSKWTSCLIGCLVVLGVIMVLVIIFAVWVGRNWRGWAADIGTQAVSQAVDSSDLPPQEKGEVKAQADRIAQALRAGQISAQQAGEIIQKVFESPLMPTIIVGAIDQHYLQRSGLNDQEKTEGKQTLKRFARGAIDKKINQQGIDAVMTHVADRQPNGEWRLRQQVSDQDLRAALTEAKKQADDAGVPAEPEAVDPSDELKRIIDESLPGA
jgi:hypothetical protein